MAQPVPGLPPEAPTMAVVPSNGTTPPAVPPTVPALPDALLPLAHGFAQYVQGLLSQQLEEAAIRMTKSVDLTMSGMAQYTQGVLTANEHAEYSLAHVLEKLHSDGLKVYGAPYEMRLQVYTHAGIPLQFTIRHTSPAALLDELTRLETWLALQGYTATPPALQSVA